MPSIQASNQSVSVNLIKAAVSNVRDLINSLQIYNTVCQCRSADCLFFLEVSLSFVKVVIHVHSIKRLCRK